MNDSMNEPSPPEIGKAAQSGVCLPDPVTAQAVPARDAAERHAAVCAGAIEYLPDLRAFARSLSSSPHQADDLVQGAILRALGASHQFKPDTNIKAWLFTILRNLCFNQWRSPGARSIPLDDCFGHMPVTIPDQDANLEFCDFRRAFAQLVPEQREALMLVGAAGLDYQAAAAVCGCAVGTVKSRVSRGRAIVKSLMEGSGAMSLRRQDVVPVSTMDIAFALAGSGAALHRPAHAP
jgi:RNA polymerase sigma-70 factor (ECF subfamily)